VQKTAAVVIQEQQLEAEEQLEEKEPEEDEVPPPQEELAAAENLIALNVNETVAAVVENVVAQEQMDEQQSVVFLHQADRGIWFFLRNSYELNIFCPLAVVIQLPTVVDLEEEKEVEAEVVLLPVQVPLTPAQLQARAMNVIPVLGKTNNELFDENKILNFRASLRERSVAD